MNQIERNIIVGSLLGDGSLDLSGRSVNARYREHGCDAQMNYRKWKAEQLKGLDFKFSDKGKYGLVYSLSRERFTKLYHIFYTNKVKVLTKESVKLLDHPIGLACLYMDDGSLVISSNKRKDSIYLSPQLTIYSLNFSEEENIILRDHINNTFGVNFILKKRRDGKHYVLGINKQNDIVKFLDVVRPYVSKIDCMNYKIDIVNRLNKQKKELQLNYPDNNITIASLNVVDNSYSNKDERLIISMKNNGYKDKEIADILSRPYWGMVDKIRRLRKENKL